MKKLLCLIVVMWMLIATLSVVFAIPGATAGQAPAVKMTDLERRLYQDARKEGKLEWWDSLPMKDAAALMEAFKSRYPGVDVVFFEASSDVREEKFLAEHQAGRHTVDVLPVELYGRFKKEGLVSDLSGIIKDVGYPSKFSTTDLDAVTLEHLLMGAAFNVKLVAPANLPRSWEDLLDPKWKGKIAVENRLKFFSYNTPNWGEEKTIGYLRNLREQKPTFTKGNTETLTLLQIGEFPLAVGVYLHTTLTMKEGGASVDFLPFSPSVHLLQTTILQRYAPHPNAGRLFLRWYISPEGQAMVDKIRQKGSPAPGSGTIQSKAVEKMGLKIYTASAWGVDYGKLENRYSDAVGFIKKKVKK